MNRLLRALLCGGLIALLAQPGFSWGNEGHQMVARIAARNLTPTARRNIVALLRSAAPDDLKLLSLVGKGTEPQPPDGALEEALAKMATWPDHMPGGKGITQPWHFIDIGLFEGPANMAARCEEACVNGKIKELQQNLRAKQAMGKFGTDKELRFLVHLMGDIHQPLHASTNADAGGNCVHVTGFGDDFSQLHAVWDTALVREIIDEADDDVVDEIVQEFQAKRAQFITTLDADAIAKESFAIAKASVYGKATPAIPTIKKFLDVSPKECSTQAPKSVLKVHVNGETSYDNAATKTLIREQLDKAGVRLGAILNQLFG